MGKAEVNCINFQSVQLKARIQRHPFPVTQVKTRGRVTPIHIPVVKLNTNESFKKILQGSLLSMGYQSYKVQFKYALVTS